ncbi:MAG: hypothetical protein IJ060_01970 [Oscillospiraceae bacterium]|nr:hypothetical protein [Oscillospiraceae bacterium]
MKRYRITAAALAAICLLTGCSPPQPHVQQETSLDDTAALTTQQTAGTTESTQTASTVTEPAEQQPADSIYMNYYHHPDMSLDEALEIICNLNLCDRSDSYFDMVEKFYSFTFPSTNLEQLTVKYNSMCFNDVRDELIEHRSGEPFSIMISMLYDKKYKSIFGMNYEEIIELERIHDKRGNGDDSYEILVYKGKNFADWAGRTDFHDVPFFLKDEYYCGMAKFYGDKDIFDREWKKTTDSLNRKNLSEMSLLELWFYAVNVAEENKQNPEEHYSYKDIPISIGTPIVRRMEETVKEETEGYPYWKQMDSFYFDAIPNKDSLVEITASNAEEMIDTRGGKYNGLPIPLPDYYEIYKQEMQKIGIQIPDTVEEAYSLILAVETSTELHNNLYDSEMDEDRWWEVSDYVQNLPKVTDARLFVNTEGVSSICPYEAIRAFYVEGDGWIFIDG